MPETSQRPPSTVFATVATFDAQARRGSVLLDDGRPVAFDAEVFAASGLLHLRLGQRVRLQLAAPADDEGSPGTVTSLTLSTFPAPGTDPRTTGLGRP